MRLLMTQGIVDVSKCSHFIMVPEHYRPNGECLCSNQEHRDMMVREWGYTPEDFEDVPLVD